MQRRLTKNEVWKIGRAYDSLHGLTPPIDSTAARDCRMLLQDMLTHNTTDGLPYVEPPLTDEDARQRPWVMVRDSDGQPWKGPHRFAAKCVDEHYPYYVFSEDKTSAVEFNCCRRATSEEIAAAGLENPDA
jgi:hypothetical protein